MVSSSGLVLATCWSSRRVFSGTSWTVEGSLWRKKKTISTDRLISLDLLTCPKEHRASATTTFPCMNLLSLSHDVDDMPSAGTYARQPREIL